MTKKQKLEANIWKYYIMRILAKRVITPILFIFLLSRGLSTTEIGITVAVGTFFSVLLEMPSGMIADYIGHKYTLALSFVFQGAAMLCYIIGDNFWWYLAASVLYWGFGSFLTGTNVAFIYETLKDLKRGEEFEKIEGRSILVGFLSNMILLAGAGFVFVYNDMLLFYINFVLFVLAFFLVITMTQPTFRKNVSKAEGWQALIHNIKRITRFIKTNPKYRAVVLGFSFSRSIHFSFADFSQLYFEFLNVPREFFGLVYSAKRALTAFGASIAHRFKHRVNQVSAVPFFSGTLSVYFFVLALVQNIAGVFIYPLRAFINGFSKPLYSRYLNEEIKHGDRVALLSFGNLLTGFFRVVFVLLLGLMFDLFSVPSVLTIIGVFIGVVSVALFVYTKKFFAK